MTATTAKLAPSDLRTGDDVPVLDREHLSRNTFGDEALKHEILGLFAGQLDQLRWQLVMCATPADWRFACHTLKGAAAAVGASRLVRLAKSWEAQGLISADGRSSLLAAFDQEVSSFRSAMAFA